MALVRVTDLLVEEQGRSGRPEDWIAGLREGGKADPLALDIVNVAIAVIDAWPNCEDTFDAVRAAVALLPNRADEIVANVSVKRDCNCSNGGLWLDHRVDDRLRVEARHSVLDVPIQCSCSQVALYAGLTPIVCLGESQQERESGVTEQIVGEQLKAVLDKVGIAAFGNIVIAYEPVWAIGTGLTATPEQAQEVHAFIRAALAAEDAAVADQCRILYGGSMKPDNAAELISKPDIDGGLIGGASLTSEDFLGICSAA